MALRKIDLMHRQFGMCDGHVCGECSNLVSAQAGKRPIYKCRVYGDTSSAASDWARRWLACGKFNQPYSGRPIIELVRRSNPRPPEPVEEPLDGQITLEV